jgi:DNA-binding NtrC family response regulator
MQSKLLRALQEQEVEPLGSNQVLKVDVRVIAATSRDLAAMVAEGRFRADLYYRLHVLPIRLPALRERPGDLEALAESLLDDIARRSGLAHRHLSAEALELLSQQAWPGNIRELRNVLEQATLMTDDLLLEPRHFGLAAVTAGEGAPPVATPAAFEPRPAAAGPPRPLPEQIAALERRAISEALAATAGNKLAAAKLLGIARATLYEKLAAYGSGAGET